MTITIAGIDFDYRDYDERSDVLYLHVGPPNGPAAKTLETPEGHTVEYNEHDAIIGLELMGVRDTLERNEETPTHLATRTSRGKRSPSGARGLSRPAVTPLPPEPGPCRRSLKIEDCPGACLLATG